MYEEDSGGDLCKEGSQKRNLPCLVCFAGDLDQKVGKFNVRI
jgi:hypothetical protein